MSVRSLLQYALFLLVVAFLVKPVGGYLARVFNAEKTFLDPILRPAERLIYKIARVDPEQKVGLAGLTVNGRPHGFTEIFYAYASSFTNNGQNFAGMNANAPFYNVTTAIAMMVGSGGAWNL